VILYDHCRFLFSFSYCFDASFAADIYMPFEIADFDIALLDDDDYCI
jgi:hypothetical protein